MRHSELHFCLSAAEKIFVDSTRKFLNLIVVVLAVVMVVLLVTKRKPHSEVHLSSLSKPDINMESKINQYMQEVQRRKTTDELHSIGRLQRNIELNSRPSIEETDPSTVPRDRQIWKDDTVEAANSTDQMDVIYRRIYEEEIAKRTTDEAKKEYATEFVEYARRSGYHIQLSMDLEVISVQPIRNPQGEFDSIDIKD